MYVYAVKISARYGRLLKQKELEPLCDTVTAEVMRRKNQRLRPAGPQPIISNALPFKDGEFYVPRPAGITSGLNLISVKNQKYLRKIKYIPVDMMGRYFDGSFDYSMGLDAHIAHAAETNGQPYAEPLDGGGIYVIGICRDKETLSEIQGLIADAAAACFSKLLQSDDLCITQHELPDQIMRVLADTSEYVMLLNDISTENVQEHLSSLLTDGFYHVKTGKSQGTAKDSCVICAGACLKRNALHAFCSQCDMELSCIGIPSFTGCHFQTHGERLMRSESSGRASGSRAGFAKDGGL